MDRTITQRQLRNDSAAVLREVQAGQTVIVTRNSVPVAELRPVAAVTLAELAAGPHGTSDDDERARRQDRLQWVAATWDPLPFDSEAARILRPCLRGD